MKHLLLLVIFSAGALAEPPPDYRFRFEVLATGLAQPMTMQPAPDGRILFHEIAGKVRALDPSTRKISELGTLEVTTAQENGLLGMALDPGYAANGWIYFLHSPKDFDGQVISRFTMIEGRIEMGSRKDLLRWPEQRRECCHHAGALRFGPDGCLLASTGDNTHPFGDSNSYAPIDERPGREPWDAQKSAANTNDLRGKILRIRPTPEGGYSIPEGNLFPPGTQGTRPEIYAMGLRNPWRFQIDSKTGIVYAGDVGPDAGGDHEERGPRGFDTINQIRRASNFGWPYSRGNRAYKEFDFVSHKVLSLFDPQNLVNNSPNNTGRQELPPVEPPLIWYPSGSSAEFPLLGGGGRTACAGPLFRFDPRFRETGGFPEHFDGCLLIYDWQRPFLNWARLDANATLVGLEPFTAAARLAQGAADRSERFQIKRPVDMFFGSDGCLYLADYGETWGVNVDARIVKVSYQRGNMAPIARASGTGTEGREPLTVALSAAGSRDPEGGSLRYEWRREPGGELLATTREASATFPEPGNFTAELRVTDPEGAASTAAVLIAVGNTPPTIRFRSPVEGDFFTPGRPIAYQVDVSDAEDGSSSEPARTEEMGVRTLVSASWESPGGKGAETAPGLARMKQSDCFNCHTVEQRLVGPSLLEIADRYRGEPGAVDATVGRVLKGSSGEWGPIPMLPHPQHTVDELHLMVSWIFSLEKGRTGSGVTRGLSGQIAPPNNLNTRGGLLEATYIDAGRQPAGPLAGKATVHLRSRRLEAEAADEIAGAATVGLKDASGGKGVRATAPGQILRFSNLNLEGSSSITCRVARASQGGRIQLRAGSAEGECLADLPVQPTGTQDAWTELATPIKAPAMRGDVLVVFVSGGMNLDWVEFK